VAARGLAAGGCGLERFGFAFAALGLILSLAVIAYRLLRPEDFSKETAGWASLMVALLLIAGIQMIFFGVLGEYTGRTFLKVNRKPQASVRAVLNACEPAAGTETRPRVVSTER